MRSGESASFPLTAHSEDRTRGRVSAFDEHRGLGTVISDSGEEYMFHCIEIVDGTRRIDVGAHVEFTLREKFSRAEAFEVRILA